MNFCLQGNLAISVKSAPPSSGLNLAPIARMGALKNNRAPLTSQLTKPPPGSFRRVCCSQGSARSRQGADAVGQRLRAAQRHEDVLRAASRQHVFPCIWVGLEQPCFIVTKNGLDDDPANCNKESSVICCCSRVQAVHWITTRCFLKCTHNMSDHRRHPQEATALQGQGCLS